MIGASERSGPGLWASIACRKRYIDDNLAAALGDAVVVLRAGLDSRAYRLTRRTDVSIFEVDLSINVARKLHVVAKVLGAPPPSVHLVSAAAAGSRIDFTYVRSDFLSGANLHGADTLDR